MSKQVIEPPFNILSFLENGALLQLSPDLFKLITGPFTLVTLQNFGYFNSSCFIYQPLFWDFIHADRQGLSGLQGVSTATMTRQAMKECLQSTGPVRPKIAWENVNSQTFKEQFEWTQTQIAEEKLLKSVPIISQTAQTRLTSQNRAFILLNLLNENYPGWGYGLWQNGEGYLGQTPELIAEWNPTQEILSTVALAGTLKNTVDNENLILQDSKIRQEHQFVVDDVESRLAQVFSPKQIQKAPTEVLKLKQLLHLKTDFQCAGVELQQAWRAIESLHPTAALGIYPRKEDQMKRFSELNIQTERKNFAAPFAILDEDRLLCVAAIRNFFFSKDAIAVFSGCGVTADSVYESELSELELKRESVKRMMGLSE